MSNILRRILVFALGLPLLVASVFVFPGSNHPIFLLIVVVASALSAVELRDFFPKKATGYPGSVAALLLTGALPPITAILVILTPLPVTALTALLPAATAIIMTVQAFRKESSRFREINETVTSHLFILIYPGYFAAHVILLTTLQNSSLVLLLYLLSVYLNDSMAYVSGMLLGKRSKPLVPISPNKTRVGFAGGFLASVIVAVGLRLLLPQLLPGALWKAVLFGVIVGGFTIAGDLVESALKRSAEIKDSGTLIPGRGGLLDSIDSPLFVAPIFYYTYYLLFLLEA